MSHHAATLAVSAGLVTLVPAPGVSQTARPTAPAVLGRLARDEARLVRATRATSAIVLDGHLDEAAWTLAQRAEGFVQQRPTPGAPASERTEARVVFDAQAIYVSMRLFDSHPDSLIAPLARRDYEGYGDWAHVIIDSYHDRRTAFHFAVNPAGTKRDGMFANDVAWQEDNSWDAVWDVATARDSLGWTAEFRIPLTQLRFEQCAPAAASAPTLARRPDSTTAPSACEWGIEFMRDLARRNERSLWAPIEPNAGSFVSRFGTLAGVDGLRSPRRVELVPYSLARATRSPRDGVDPFYRRTATAAALGADLGLGLTSKLTLTATINPDFGQVEADPSEVNLTGSETFLGERRPFFVEGSDIFRYQLGDGFFGQEQLFYSRRIGRAPQVDDPDGASAVDRPAATSIFGAAKVSGKAGAWTLGILDAVTSAERARFASGDTARGTFMAEPRTNYAFARLSRDGSDGRNSVGLSATAVNRDLDPNAAKTLRSSAAVAGIDGRLRSPGRNYNFSANLIGSYVRGSPEAITETQRSFVHLMQRPERGETLDTTRTSLAGWSAEVRAAKQGGGRWRWALNGRAVSSGFETNDLGFQLRSDVVSTTGWIGFTHFEPGRILRSWELWTNTWGRWTFDGSREMLAANLWAHADLQNNWTVMAEAQREFSQRSPTALRGGPAMYVVPNVTWWTRVVSDQRRMLSGELMARVSLADADGASNLTVAPMLTLRPSARAEVSLQPTLRRVKNPSQYVETAVAGADTSYVTGSLTQTTSSLTARLNLTFSPTLSLQLYAEPFLSTGDYATLGEVRAPRARSLAERIAPFAGSSITRAGDELRIDRGGLRAPITLDDPNFGVRSLKSNAVLRWEYRPGSALFLVWAQQRDHDDDVADVTMGRQARDLWRTAGTNVLLIKASYWLTPR